MKKEEIDVTGDKKINTRQNVKKKRKRKAKTGLILTLGIILGMVWGILFSLILFKNKEENDNTDRKIEENVQNSTENEWEEMMQSEGFVIETPFVELYYPKKWKQQIDIEINEEEEYRVCFFATMQDKEKIEIFDVVFGGEEGSTIGYIKESKDKNVPVNIISYDLKFDESWTDEEINDIYAMLDSINYVIESLQKENEFVSNY